MPPEKPSVLARFREGSVVTTPQGNGLDQETWIVQRDVLLDLCRELKTSRETRFGCRSASCTADELPAENATTGSSAISR